MIPYVLTVSEEEEQLARGIADVQSLEVARVYAEALLNAELSDSAISVPSSGLSKLRLRSNAISSVAEKPSAGSAPRARTARTRRGVCALCERIARLRLVRSK